MGKRLLLALGGVIAISGAAAGWFGHGRPNVVIIVIDTLRADHLGCYGYARETSPEIDRLAGHGLLFERAIAQAPWTAPSVASLFTGNPPASHGAIGSIASRELRARLAAEQTTLAERFRAAGYRTAAFVTNPNIAHALGFGQGFETYVEQMLAPAGAVTRWAIEQLADPDPRPLFLYLHYMDPHSDYTPPRGYRRLLGCRQEGRLGWRITTEDLHRVNFGGLQLRPEEAAYLTCLYDAEIAYVDGEIGKLFRESPLREVASRASPFGRLLPRRRRGSVVVLTADHGEELLDHGGVFHGFTVFREMTHVPLLWLGKGIPRGRRSAMVRLIDVAPTLLELAGLERDERMLGRSLRPLFGQNAGEDRPAMTQAEMVTQFKPVKLDALETVRWKYIHDHVAGRTALYDLRADPGEQRDLSRELPGEAVRLEEELATLLAALRSSPPHLGLVDAATEERLRQLGY